MQTVQPDRKVTYQDCVNARKAYNAQSVMFRAAQDLVKQCGILRTSPEVYQSAQLYLLNEGNVYWEAHYTDYFMWRDWELTKSWIKDTLLNYTLLAALIRALSNL